MSAGALASAQVWRAVLLMLASACLFGCMAVVIRLASAQLHPFEIAFFRNLFGLVFALPLLLRHGPGLLKTSKLPLYFFRSTIGIISMLCGFWAIVNLPLAQAVSLSYSTPLFVTIGAVLVLGEVVRARRWTAVALGFVGVILILRPGAEFSPGVLVALLAAALSAAVAISIKFLSRTEKPDAIVLYTTLLWVPLSLVPALWVWENPQGITWLWIVLAGFFGTAGHMFWARALQLGDASMLTPISFLQVPIVATAGYLLFEEHLDAWIVVGAGIIFLANAYIAHREAQLARRAVTDPEIANEPPAAR
ncbi:DMT family transporter [Aquimonas voraii]|uniref:EamA domain-containing membrane protein RarD n=1 Tax=Aquimonas voraii TaxID=265719 RepID=A0A1G6T3Z4_9GAMM|nr:DMT family transporter [Aquimonas voraii]SDD23862.1 EamA domain-containing membrane protein RarD [Aquimonas voraii]